MNTPQPPAAPNAPQIAQSASVANNTNQSTPTANLNYTQGPNGQWTATSTPTGPMANVFSNNANAAANESPVNINNAIQSGTGMYSNAMQPFFQQQQSNLASQLQNQGFNPTDQAAQLQTQTLDNAQAQSVAQNASSWVNPALQAYQAPIQAAETALNPNYVATPQNGNNVNEAYQTQAQGQQFNYGQQMQNNSAMLGGLFSIPSAALGGWARNGFSLGGAGAGGGSSIATSLGLGSGISDADLLASLALV